MSKTPKIAIIAAVADNGMIGTADGLPWQIKSEMQYFMRMTKGKPVVMGRKTFQTLGKPLKDRTNIIITRDTSYKIDGAHVAHSLEAAINLAQSVCTETGAEEIMICGGEEIYYQSLPIADILYLTEVHCAPNGNTKFPSFNKNEWTETMREHHTALPGETADYTITSYRRLKPSTALP